MSLYMKVEMVRTVTRHLVFRKPWAWVATEPDVAFVCPLDGNLHYIAPLPIIDGDMRWYGFMLLNETTPPVTPA